MSQKNVSTLIYRSLFLLSLVVCCKIVTAQQEIDMNKISDTLSDIKKIENKKKVYIKIINVNKDLYDVTINGSKISYNTEAPTLLTLATFALPPEIPFKRAPSVTELSHEMVTVVDLNTREQNSSTCTATFIEQKDIISKQLQAFKTTINNINSAINYYNYLGQIQKKCVTDMNSVVTEKNTAAKRVFGQIDTPSIRSFFSTNYRAAEVSYQAIQTALNKIDSLIHHANCPASESGKMKSLMYTDREQDVLKAVDKIYEQVSDMITNDQASLVINRFTSINPSNFTVTSETIQAKQADKIQFTVSIKPKNWIPCDAVEKNFKVTYKVKGGIKVDFSSGIFGSFGKAAFQGHSYYLDSLQTIRRFTSSAKSFIPSIGGLLHVYYRSGGNINSGIAAGASVTTDLKITNFHAGVSFMLNVDNEILNRLALTGGLTWRYAKDLSPSYTEGTAVDKTLTIDQLETGKYKQGWFVALTWNLTKK